MRAPSRSVLAITLLTAIPAFAQEGPVSPAKPSASSGIAGAAKTNKETTNLDWQDMDKKQRKAYMKKVVLPTAQKLFAEFDAKKYKRINCATCHGEGAEKDFKMPNPGLPKLPSSPAGFAALQEKKGETMKFMATKVKPTIAGLLGRPEFTPDRPEGFGCQGCHTSDASTGPLNNTPPRPPAK